MPIGLREVKIPLSPCAMLECGRGQPVGYSGVVEGLNMVNAAHGTPPPCRRKIQCQGEVDTRFPSLVLQL